MKGSPKKKSEIMCFTQLEFHNTKPLPKLGSQNQPILEKNVASNRRKHCLEVISLQDRSRRMLYRLVLIDKDEGKGEKLNAVL